MPANMTENMTGVRDLGVPLRRISPVQDDGQYFFGYYDLPAFSGDDRFHLANRVRFRDRQPRIGETSTLGLIDLESLDFQVLAETAAWNFQQGSMLQWYPEGSKTQVLYNDYRDSEYCAVIRDLPSGRERLLSRPLAAVSPDGRWGLSINFNRVYDFRPGYGYNNRPDPWFNDPQPVDDGVFLVDLATGASCLIISYRQLGGIYNTAPELRRSKIVVNHITFNRDSDRFIFLVRTFPEPGAGWQTGIGSADLDGRVYLWRPYTYASHYHWQDGRHLLIHADAGAGKALYDLTDLSQEARIIAAGYVRQDIHCCYSPDRRLFSGDAYPDHVGYRELFLYSPAADRGLSLGRFRSAADSVGDFRCDLHARWNRAGDQISFDSTHENRRGIYLLDLRQLRQGDWA